MFLHLVNYARKAISAQIRYWNAIRELNALTDRELQDLGITRLEIAYTAGHAAFKGINHTETYNDHT